MPGTASEGHATPVAAAHEVVLLDAFRSWVAEGGLTLLLNEKWFDKSSDLGYNAIVSPGLPAANLLSIG
jgi:hypothetical protein